MKIEDLGLTKKQLLDLVIDKLCNDLLVTRTFDPDGDEHHMPTDIERRLEKAIKERIDEQIDSIAQKHLLPNVSEYIENISLQKTNQWGEAQGKSFTFIEYLVQRADHYMKEQVDFDGRTKGERDSYRWIAAGTRVECLINKHLHYSIEKAMKDALKSANDSIVGGLEEAVKIKLSEIQNNLKVTVKTGR